MLSLRYLLFRNSCTQMMPRTFLICTRLPKPNKQIKPIVYFDQCDFKRNIMKFSNSATENAVKTCQQCGAVNKKGIFLQCEKCQALQTPNEDISYFDLLDIPESYDVNYVLMAKNFKRLQMQFHPDRFAQKQNEQHLSDTISSVINNAYKTLLDPFLRGLYILKRQNIDFPEDSKEIDQTFLIEIMELNLELDDANDTNSLRTLKNNVMSSIEKYTKHITKEINEKNYNFAKNNLVKLNYFINIQNKLLEKEFELNSKS